MNMQPLKAFLRLKNTITTSKLAFVLMPLIMMVLGCKATQECIGEPKPEQICTMDYNPVCGCNGKTYSNSCRAEAEGVKSWTLGECK